MANSFSNNSVKVQYQMSLVALLDYASLEPCLQKQIERRETFDLVRYLRDFKSLKRCTHLSKMMSPPK